LKTGAGTDDREITMKIRSAEYLVAIAIVTSAAVLQIREHMRVEEAPVAGAQAASSCGIAHDGLMAARCQRQQTHTVGGRRDDRALRLPHRAVRIWV
jgi:hypothetical protein